MPDLQTVPADMPEPPLATLLRVAWNWRRRALKAEADLATATARLDAYRTLYSPD